VCVCVCVCVFVCMCASVCVVCVCARLNASKINDRAEEAACTIAMKQHEEFGLETCRRSDVRGGIGFEIS
jgi:hypothetical protein